jgi:hypothetical protein
VSYQEVVMPSEMRRDFRTAVCARLVAGEKVSLLSEELGRQSPPDLVPVRWIICGPQQSTRLGHGLLDAPSTVVRSAPCA